MLDVHIIGGGPAGCFAGIAACLEGKNALISEEHRKIGEPVACSGLISKSGLDALSKFVDYRKAAINTIDSARVISGKEEFCIKPSSERAILVDRERFDTLAAERFELEGGKIELGRRVTRDFRCRAVIGCDGPASSVAARFGFPKIRSFVAAMQGDFEYACNDPHEAVLYLSSRDSPGFFGWAIPKNEEEAKLGIGVALPRHPLPHYRRFISRLGVGNAPKNEFSAVIPTSLRRATVMEKGGHTVLLAGDSAGQVKATTGGGVFFGASCGLLSGKYCSKPKEYERQWKRAFWLDLALHRHLRSLLDVSGGQPHPLFLTSAKALFFDDLLSEKGKMDRLGQMIKPSLLADYARIIKRNVIKTRGRG
jgi:flavin-dependent dehydrogenase